MKRALHSGCSLAWGGGDLSVAELKCFGFQGRFGDMLKVDYGVGVSCQTVRGYTLPF